MKPALPMFLGNLPIKRKLTLISMSTSGAVLLLACLAFVGYEQITFRSVMVRDLSIIAQMIGFNSSSALSFDDARSAEQTLQGLAAQPHIQAACIFDTTGKVFATFQRASDPSLVWPSALDKGAAFTNDALDLFHPMMLAGEKLGTIYIRSDLDQMAARLQRYIAISLVIMVVAVAAALVITARMQRIISNPVSELASVARTVAQEKNYAIRAVKNSDDELGQLIDGFNDMLGHIQSRDAALQRARDELEKRVEERTAALQLAQRDSAQKAAQLRFIFESVPVGVTWVHYATKEHMANRGFCQIIGLPLEKIGNHEVVRAHTHPDDLKRQDQLRDRLERGEIDRMELEKRYVRPDGRIAWVVLTIEVFRESDGRIAQEVCTVVDITERKQAEARLANSLSILNATLESTADGILVVNLEGRAINHNRKFAEMWRISPETLAAEDDEKMLQSVLAQLKHPEGFLSKIRELYSHPETESFDTLVFADGRVFERYSQPHRVEDVIVGRVWCFRDVTERKQAEADRERIQRQLIDVSRQAGMAEVATGVLHNVGNVLNSVNVAATLVIDQARGSKGANLFKLSALLQENAADLGRFFTEDPRGQRVPAYINLLARELAEERETAANELEHLRKHIEHIKEIVAMQQSYAKISGVAETIPLTDLVEDALRMNAVALDRHGLEVVREYEARPVATIERHKLLQILVNLIRNAKYACDDSGRLDKQLTVRITETAERIQISIIDNGVGIPPENLTRIFAHGFTTRQDGHGFGLHSGALVAREMGGALFAHSDGPGRGARFTLEIPSQLTPVFS